MTDERTPDELPSGSFAIWTKEPPEEYLRRVSYNGDPHVTVGIGGHEALAIADRIAALEAENARLRDELAEWQRLNVAEGAAEFLDSMEDERER